MALLTVVGCGPGDLSMLTPQARDAVATSGRVFASRRLAEGLKSLNNAIVPASTGEILQRLSSEVSDTVVAVSGDTGFFSLASTLRSRLDGLYELCLLPGVSSMQLMCARLGVSYEDVEFISVHGRNSGIIGPAAYCRRVFYLTGGTDGAANLLDELCRSGLGDRLAVTVGEDLSYPNERISRGTAAELASKPFAPLAVVLVENPAPAPVAGRLRDGDFQRGDVPMTKEPVRVLSVSRLEMQPGGVVYDIGAGTGSISVALARVAWKGTVFAIEQKPEALALIECNRQGLGAFNIQIVPGAAPDALEYLPPPDRVFIGGSGGRIVEIVDALTVKSDCFTLCINAVTLESVHAAMTLLESRGFDDVEIECVQVSRAKKAGDSHLMQAQNPVYIISGRWRA